MSKVNTNQNYQYQIYDPEEKPFMASAPTYQAPPQNHAFQNYSP